MQFDPVAEEVDARESLAPMPAPPEEEEEVWLWHFGELRKMGPGGKVTQTVRAPGV